MKFVSWNVNGLRACLKKGFSDYLLNEDADFVCLQETKMQPDQAGTDFPGYREYWYSAEKKGYSGTAILARHEPLSAVYGIGVPEYDCEGRTITLEYPDFYLVTAYVPNSQQGLTRLGFRMNWEDEMRAYLRGLDGQKPVVYCGDLNVAHEDIDLKNPGPNRGSAGFTDEERAKLSELLAAGFTDTFRALHPGMTGAYSWWSYRFHARDTNAGWRIDYFLVSDRLFSRVRAADIRAEVTGSDHCPVTLELE